MIRAPLRTGATLCSSAMPSMAVEAALRASSMTALIAVNALASLSSVSRCFCDASDCSIRATASSTMLVSALRLRLAYSPRNQRPRAVSMKASLIAS